jgi:hypothetical protein
MRRWWPRVPPLLVVFGVCALALGGYCMRSIWLQAGGFALPLDDSFIHLQFARRLAEGHWFHYAQGAGYSSGATSFLWPLLLTPWFWLGLDDLQLVAVMWGYGVLLHAAVSYDCARFCEGLAGRGPGLAAGAMCLVFGGFAWFSYSGMETMAIAWFLIRGARIAAEHEERGRHRWQLLVLGLLAPLARPEGALVSLFAGAGAWRHGDRKRAWLPLLGPLLIPLSHKLHSGHVGSSTAQVKWLLLDPYLDPAQKLEAVAENAKLLVTDLLNGGHYTALFLPSGFGVALALAVFCLPLWALRRPRCRFRLVLLLMLLAATFAPCTYGTMLWNRVRYIWPFAPGWFVAIALLFAYIGKSLESYRSLLGSAAAALSWAAVALLAAKLNGAVSDLANSARAIAGQQVELGRWARDGLPKTARIGVNDTGAIAYLSRRSTFDVVGLTTEGEAPYWVAGSGSRYEHYEGLSVSRLPTHFVVYPGWMHMSSILGQELKRASVYNQSILGGTTMIAYRADYRLLGSGALPRGLPGGALLDEVDVSDLESERAHAYVLADATAGYNVAHVGDDAQGKGLTDGGRLQRSVDAFALKHHQTSRMVLRAWSRQPLQVFADGVLVGLTQVRWKSASWMEQSIALPAAKRIEVRGQGERFSSYHYWFYARALP